MTQISLLSDAKTKQLWMLRKYLRQNQVSGTLYFRILRYMEYSYQKEAAVIPESKVAALGRLSRQLTTELRYLVSFSCLKLHYLFDVLNHVSPNVHSITAAMTESVLAMGDMLFVVGTESLHMHCVVSGNFAYLQKHLTLTEFCDVEDVGEMSSPGCSVVSKGCWFSEASLWTNWSHAGSAQSTLECSLISIASEGFSKIIVKDAAAFKIVSVYSRKYVEIVANTKRRFLTDVVTKELEPYKLISEMEAEEMHAILRPDRSAGRDNAINRTRGVLQAVTGLGGRGKRGSVFAVLPVKKNDRHSEDSSCNNSKVRFS
eukprot:TRINITY_DN72030_c0_g1_i1.p1 TRINITY_DN72030_c0_g1~~TRINITY_DN72030_c0_g1_i1.p1  ORF type:complete len:364 (+),score=23.06 TRINITY_DN72030_c0_g1_i1:147-1094(+)